MTKSENEKILRYAKKIKLLNYLGGCCEVCKETNIFLLTFHHTDENKEFHYGEYSSYRLSKLKNETDKCIILCHNCHREYHYDSGNPFDRRRNYKKIYLEYKGSSCVKCGYDKCPASLDFHHINNDDKIFIISSYNKNIKSIYDLDNLIKDEMDKCEIMCANCHVLNHSDVDFYDKYQFEIINKVDNYKEKQSKIDVEEVIRMVNNGIKQVNIAKHFSASKGTISDIIKKNKNRE